MILKYSSKYILFCIILFVFKFKKISILLLSFIFFFHREITINKNYNDKDIMSPATGKIDKIILNQNTYTISIFLGLFDHHIQYSPMNSKIKNIIYKPGKFKPAYFFEKTKYNERLITTLETKIGEIVIEQIAGQIARNVIHFNFKNSIIQKQDKLGMITFGSRVNITLPKTVKLLVKEGQYIYAGNHIIASI